MWLTKEEVAWLLNERARAMRDTPGVRLSADGRYVLASERLRGTLYVAGRDRDGSVMATVCCARGTQPSTRYVRKLRCPRQGDSSHRSPAMLRRKLTK